MPLTNKDTENYVIARGDVFFAPKKADGTLGGERNLGEAPSVSLNITSESVKHYRSNRGVRVQDRSVPVQTDRGAKFGLDEINPRNLAMLLLGTSELVAIASADDQTETFEDTEQGLRYQVGISDAHPAGLEKVTITAVKVGVTAKVLNTDYTVDELGGVTIVEGGTIANGADIIVEYDRLAASQARTVSGSTVVEGALRIVEHNLEGDDKTWYMGEVKLSPDGDFVIKSENDWQKMSFNVDIQEPAGSRPAILCNGRAFGA